MTATDPRPELAAMLAERLASAAAALAGACAEDIGAGPPPLFLLTHARQEAASVLLLSRLREGPGAGLSAQRGFAGLRPPLPLARKRERRSSGLAPAFQRAQ